MPSLFSVSKKNFCQFKIIFCDEVTTKDTNKRIMRKRKKIEETITSLNFAQKCSIYVEYIRQAAKRAYTFAQMIYNCVDFKVVTSTSFNISLEMRHKIFSLMLLYCCIHSHSIDHISDSLDSNGNFACMKLNVTVAKSVARARDGAHPRFAAQSLAFRNVIWIWSNLSSAGAFSLYHYVSLAIA